jgi:putative membrane protein
MRTKPLDEGTALALTRSVLAAERTLMAWIRTALSMISFGFTMVKFFQFMETSRGGPTRGLFGRAWSPEVVGLAMMSIGTGALVLAVVEHWNTLRAFRAEGFENKWSLSLVVAALIATLGFFALVTILVGD